MVILCSLLVAHGPRSRPKVKRTMAANPQAIATAEDSCVTGGERRHLDVDTKDVLLSTFGAGIREAACHLPACLPATESTGCSYGPAHERGDVAVHVRHARRYASGFPEGRRLVDAPPIGAGLNATGHLDARAAELLSVAVRPARERPVHVDALARERISRVGAHRHGDFQRLSGARRFHDRRRRCRGAEHGRRGLWDSDPALRTARRPGFLCFLLLLLLLLPISGRATQVEDGLAASAARAR